MFVFVCLFLDCFLYIKIAIHSVIFLMGKQGMLKLSITASHEGMDKENNASFPKYI